MSARAIRAIFFDAGNTLIRMDLAAVAAALAHEGVTASADDVQRAEWRARVRLDASFRPGASTEHPSTGERYLVYASRNTQGAGLVTGICSRTRPLA